MGIPQWVENLYSDNRAYFESLDGYVSASLGPFCERNNFTFRHRVKPKGSVAEKLESGRYKSWWAVDDFVAATVIVPNLTYEDIVLRQLATVFDEKVIRSRRTAITPPEVFRFNSTRWYGRVRTDPAPSLPDEAIKMIFEVQILTVFEHAWLIATHDLTYKGGSASWQHLRLTASLKSAVEQLDNMIVNFVETAASIPPSPFPETDAKAHAISVFEELIKEQLISETLRPESWSRFADNLWALFLTRKRGPKTSPDMIELIDRLAQMVRRGEFLPGLSGSLFQTVLAFVARENPDYLSNFYVIPSSEFEEIYNVSAFPRSISDGRALDEGQ